MKEDMTSEESFLYMVGGKKSFQEHSTDKSTLLELLQWIHLIKTELFLGHTQFYSTDYIQHFYKTSISLWEYKGVHTHALGSYTTAILRIHYPIIILEGMHDQKNCSNPSDCTIYVNSGNELSRQISVQDQLNLQHPIMRSKIITEKLQHIRQPALLNIIY